MQQTKSRQKTAPPSIKWIHLSQSIMFLLRHKRLVAWSSLLVMITCSLTYLGFSLGLDYIQSLTSDFFFTAPAKDSIFGWIKYGGWYLSKILFSLISHLVTFYLAFLLAFSITTPGYVFLSGAAEKKYKGGSLDSHDFSLTSILRDLLEGIKIGLFGIVVAIISLMVGFIPLIGQAAVFLMYTYYSTLMFLDYPTSQRGWTLGEKIGWLKNHSNTAFRIGFLPALLSMIPFLNIFFMALIFPILTVHTTLNFIEIEDR